MLLMKVAPAFALALFASSALAGVRTVGALRESVVLSGDEDWRTEGDLVIDGDDTITTNGHRLSWIVKGNLAINGSLHVISFSKPSRESQITLPPPPAPKAGPGPTPGSPGLPGAQGSPRKPGRPGLSGGERSCSRSMALLQER